MHEPRQASATAALAVLSALGFAWTAPSAAAQLTTLPAARFINLSAQPRDEWGTATVPFARGTFLPGQTWEPVGVPGEVRPFGARWPDGSIRYGKLTARLSLAPGADLTIPVRRTTSPQAGMFTFGPWTQAMLPNFNFEMLVGTPGGQRVAGMQAVSVEVAATEVKVLFRNRAPSTDLLYDLWVTFYRGQDHARFELRITNSNPTSPEWIQHFDYLAFAVRGAAPFVKHGVPVGVVQPSISLTGNNIVVLSGPDHIYDGQALDYYGHLFFANPGVVLPDATQRVASLLAANEQTLYGVATNWPASGAFGPFGITPEAPPWWTDGGRWFAEIERTEFLQRMSLPGQIWNDRLLGLQPAAAATGDQYDFGVSQFGDIVRSVLPHRIEEARFGVGEEAMRPVHFREFDGRMVTAANHPGWRSWSGRPHADNRLSPDRLGKPYPAPFLSGNSHGWTGKDNAHWSSLALASAYLLTTSDSLLMEIETETELFLSGHTVPSMGNFTTNNIGLPRALGRPMMTMAWNWTCTGREDLRDRLRRRAEECVQFQYPNQYNAGPVKPLSVLPWDPRAGQLIGDFWSPWQEGIAAAGLAACAEVTGSQIARDLADICSINVLLNAWDFGNPLLVAQSMVFQTGGTALTLAQIRDPQYASMTSNIGYYYWAMPAVVIARNCAVRDGDAALVSRADTILAGIRSLRTPQYTGRWDRFANWESVR